MPLDNDTPAILRPQIVLPILAFLVLVVVLAFLVFRPFILDFVVAASVALLLAPAQRRLSGVFGGRAALAAASLVLATTVMILLPVVSSLVILGQQALDAFAWLGPRLQPAALQTFWDEELPARAPWLAVWLSGGPLQAVPSLSDALARVAGGANRLLQQTLAGLTMALFDLVVFLLMLFFLLKDGGQLRAEVHRISPFSATQESAIFDHVGRTVKGVLQAMVVVPLVQAVLAGCGFWLFGVPAPLVWGVIVLFAAFVPVLGSPLGWLPAVAYLALTGPKGPALGLLAYGTLLISGIDNVVKPLILRGTAEIHPLLGFVSIMGGVLAFGPLGFLVGPIVVSLVLSAIRIYRDDLLRAPEPPAGSGW